MLELSKQGKLVKVFQLHTLKGSVNVAHTMTIICNCCNILTASINNVIVLQEQTHIFQVLFESSLLTIAPLDQSFRAGCVHCCCLAAW